MQVEKLKSHGDKKPDDVDKRPSFFFFSLFCSILKVFFIEVRYVHISYILCKEKEKKTIDDRRMFFLSFFNQLGKKCLFNFKHVNQFTF